MINTKSSSHFFQIRQYSSHRNIPNSYASTLLLNFLSVPNSTKAWSIGRYANCSPGKPRQQHSKRINQTWGIRILQRGSKEICDWKATHQNYSQLRSRTEKKWVNVLHLDVSQNKLRHWDVHCNTTPDQASLQHGAANKATLFLYWKLWLCDSQMLTGKKQESHWNVVAGTPKTKSPEGSIKAVAVQKLPYKRKQFREIRGT